MFVVESGFSAHRAVEILGPKYGSGYRIAMDIVLTAAHLRGEIAKVGWRVRDRNSFGEVDAELLWDGQTQDLDIALLRLCKTDENGFSPVQVGNLRTHPRAVVRFDMYGWPNWAWTYQNGSTPSTGGRHIKGHIHLADYSPRQNFVLSPEVPSSIKPNKWAGISGAAVVVNRYVVGVQSLHQNPDIPEALEAAPLSQAILDQDFVHHLRQAGVVVESESVPIQDVFRETSDLYQELLLSGTPSEMCRAAQFFVRYPDEDRSDALVYALRHENDIENQYWLIEAIARLPQTAAGSALMCASDFPNLKGAMLEVLNQKLEDK